MKQINQKLVLNEIKNSSLLKSGFDYFMKYNLSISNPYHNVNHTFCMMQLIIELLDSGFDTSQMRLTREKLLLYAMFHDFGHSAGMTDDRTNVDIAITNLKRFLGMQADIVPLEGIEILEDTIYPYQSEPKTLEGKILRECDCLQWTFEDYFTQTLMGLKTELHVHDFKTAVDNEVDFVKNTLIEEITIPYFKQIADSNFEEFLEINRILCYDPTN